MPSYPVTCLFCGFFIGDPYSKDPSLNYWDPLAHDEEKVAAEFQSWALKYMETRSKLSRRHLIVSSEEVENIHSLKNWNKHADAITHLSRAIIKEKDSNRYYLTGMSFIPACSKPPYKVPTDISVARIGGDRGAKFDNRRFTSFYPACIYRNQPGDYRKNMTVGYLVHAHCWAAFERRLEGKLTGANISDVVAASLKHWYTCDFSSERTGLFHSPIRYGISLSLPDLEFAMKRAQLRSFERSQMASNSIFTRIPLDIAVMIADLVCPINYTRDDLADTEIMLSLFQWKLPDFFWRLRLEEDIIYELAILKRKRTQIDLQLLRLEVMFFIADASESLSFKVALETRRQITKKILNIKKIYLESA